MVKTFPIIVSPEFHSDMKRAARSRGETLKKFVIDAISEKIVETGFTRGAEKDSRIQAAGLDCLGQGG